MVNEDLENIGDEFLISGDLKSAVSAYHKGGKTKEWIAERIGDFHRLKGYYHTAAEFYRAGGLKEKVKKIVDKLKKENLFSFASQIAAIGGVSDYYFYDRISAILEKS